MGIQNNESSGEDQPLLSEINITPFVDVVLVLLVIFIITAPILAKNALNIKLPKAESKDAAASSETIGVVVTKQGQILLSGKIMDEASFQTDLTDRVRRNKNIQAIISADEDTKHKDIIHAIDLIKKSGIEKFAFQIESPNSNSPAKE